MEGILLVLVVFFYILVRLAFGMRKDPVARDKKRFAPGLQLLKKKEYAAALAYFDLALLSQKDSALALSCRAICHLELGEPILAIADADKAAGIEAYLNGVYLTKGRALYQMAQYNQAMVALEKACWFERTNAQAYLWRGRTWLLLGQEGKANSDFAIATQLGEENAAYYIKRSHLVN